MLALVPVASVPPHQRRAFGARPRPSFIIDTERGVPALPGQAAIVQTQWTVELEVAAGDGAPTREGDAGGRHAQGGRVKRGQGEEHPGEEVRRAGVVAWEPEWNQELQPP